MNWAIELAERGYLPDFVLRLAMRRLLAQRLRQVDRRDVAANREVMRKFIALLDASPIVVAQDKANQQHYEVPAEFFRCILGPHLKYSCCDWPPGVDTLEEAERSMLRLSCTRAQLVDGMDILELGCGWGSLSLWMARQYPTARILSISNSHSQRAYITARAAELGIANLQVLTHDVGALDAASLGGRQFDRVVSVEMFEHARNYRMLLRNISDWLRPGGRLWFHIFCHREFPYLFEDQGAADWMARHFFSGGTMPSDDLMLYFQQDLSLVDHWRVGGTHYSRTLEAWLSRLDADRKAIREIFADRPDPDRVIGRWRMFLLACSELFGYHGGQEWFVAQYLFEKQEARSERHGVLQTPPSLD